MSEIPELKVTLRGFPMRTLADHLRKLADAIDRSELVEESGGLVILPDDEGITIEGKLRLCIGPAGKSQH